MPVTVTVLYPNTPDAVFNVQSYLEGHMLIVAKEMGKYGLKGYRATKIIGVPAQGVEDSEAPYSMQIQLDFDTIEDFQTAYKLTGPALTADIKTFSNKEPLIMIGNVLAKDVLL